MTLLQFRDALVTVYNADTAVRALTGRTTMNLVPRGEHIHEVNLPVLTYKIIASPQLGGVKGARRVSVQLEAWAKEASDVFTVMEGLMTRAEALFVGPTLQTQSIDLWSRRVVSREDDGPEDGVRWIRATFVFDVQLS